MEHKKCGVLLEEEPSLPSLHLNKQAPPQKKSSPEGALLGGQKRWVGEKKINAVVKGYEKGTISVAPKKKNRRHKKISSPKGGKRRMGETAGQLWHPNLPQSLKNLSTRDSGLWERSQESWDVLMRKVLSREGFRFFN